MEADGTLRNILETTCIVQARARLTPTLTHVVTYELVTSGAEDDTMSCSAYARSDARRPPPIRIRLDLVCLPARSGRCPPWPDSS